KRVVIRDPEEESTTSSIITTKTKSKDKGKRIWVEEPKPLKKKQQVEMDEEYARKMHAELNKDIDWDVAIDHVKLKAKEDPAPMSLLQEALDACAALTRRVEHLEYDKVAQAMEITKLNRRRIDTSDGTVMDDESNQGRIIDEMDKDDEDEPAEVQEVVDVVTAAKLITEVVTAASEIVTAASTIISTHEPQVPAATITAAPTKVVVGPSRRRKRVVIRDPEEESTTSSIITTKTKSKDKGKGIWVEEPKPLKNKQQVEMDEEYARKMHVELNKDIDWDVAIDHVKLKAKEDPAAQRYQSIKRKPLTEAQARKNIMMYLKNVVGFRLDYFKGMSYDDIGPIFEAKFNSNVDFLLKTKQQMEEEESRALQRINETPAEKAAKRRKLNEEVEDLKRHLEIIHNEDDDVYIKATPLARNVPVVDYEIIEINNKPYYKIIRADGTHQPTLYDERVIYLGYTLMSLIHSDEDLEIEKFKRARENKIEFAYDYGNLNASYVNEKIIFSDDYFQDIINPDFDKIDSSFQQTSSPKPYVPTVILEKIIIDLEDEVVSLLEKEKANLETIESLKSKGFELSEKVFSETENKSEHDCQVIEKVYDSEENPNVISLGMFNLSVSQSVSPISVTKTSYASNSVE
nr:hypothetical protein [Tanacetum cinerariifolium]